MGARALARMHACESLSLSRSDDGYERQDRDTSKVWFSSLGGQLVRYTPGQYRPRIEHTAFPVGVGGGGGVSNSRHTSDLNIGTLVVSLLGVLHCRFGANSVWRGACVLCLAEVSVYCAWLRCPYTVPGRGVRILCLAEVSVYCAWLRCMYTVPG